MGGACVSFQRSGNEVVIQLEPSKGVVAKVRNILPGQQVSPSVDLNLDFKGSILTKLVFNRVFVEAVNRLPKEYEGQFNTTLAEMEALHSEPTTSPTNFEEAFAELEGLTHVAFLNYSHELDALKSGIKKLIVEKPFSTRVELPLSFAKDGINVQSCILLSVVVLEDPNSPPVIEGIEWALEFQNQKPRISMPPYRREELRQVLVGLTERLTQKDLGEGFLNSEEI